MHEQCIPPTSLPPQESYSLGTRLVQWKIMSEHYNICMEKSYKKPKSELGMVSEHGIRKMLHSQNVHLWMTCKKFFTINELFTIMYYLQDHRQYNIAQYLSS